MEFQRGFTQEYQDTIINLLARAGIAYENKQFITLSLEDEHLLRKLRNYNVI